MTTHETRLIEFEDSNLLSGGVHRRVVVAFQSEKYLALADHLKVPINLAFRRLRRGRLVQKVGYGDQTILLLTVMPGDVKPSTVDDEATLAEAFEAAGGIGRVTTDQYELHLACRLIDRFGSSSNSSTS
jgi:hypothetical protein